MQAHEELVRIRPDRDASLRAWLAYHQKSATLYAELAEIDRGIIMNACTGPIVSDEAPRRSRPGSTLRGPSNDTAVATRPVALKWFQGNNPGPSDGLLMP